MNNEPLRSYITVTDMARAVGLSKSRFYMLIGSVFPVPVKIGNTRPYYNEEGQRQCLQIRKNNCGLNGLPILFQNKSVATNSKKQSSKKKTSKYESLVETLAALGLSNVSEKDIESVILSKFPAGTPDLDNESIIRTIFIALSADNVR